MATRRSPRKTPAKRATKGTTVTTRTQKPAPVEDAPVEDAPVEDAPVEDAPPRTLNKPTPVSEDLVREVLRGDWGLGQERRLRLTEAGHDYRKVQAEIVRQRNIT